MRLISVQIIGENFRSLTANKRYEFNNQLDDPALLSSKIFAGLNGSGKSNFLELLSEIFYFLEVYHLPSTTETQKASKAIGFEVEYLLPTSSAIAAHFWKGQEIQEPYIQVRILKRLGEYPEFSLKRITDTDYTLRADDNTRWLLPNRIVAYTSGQNELLSNAYYKLKYHYFKTMMSRPEEEDAFMSNQHLLFLDSHINYAIFIANLLLAEKKKQKYLLNILQIKDLRSFRISINLQDVNNKAIPMGNFLNHSIRKLKQCATTWTEKQEGKKRIYIFDYLINEATLSAFRHNFGNAFELFKTFYYLEMLNLFLVRKTDRDLMLRVHKSFRHTDDMSTPDPFRLIFRLENIMISKIIDPETQKATEISYRSLSDGEHQFNEVIGALLMMEEDGCLFLLDEPDTHFNPKWRAKMIKILNYVSAKSFDKDDNVEEVRKQEVIITTHSPFVISDTKRENVYKFVKENQVVSYSNPENIETFGASINLILQEIFDREITISDFSNSRLEKLRDRFKEETDKEKTKEKIYEARAELFEFGESIERFDLYSFLYAKEEEIEKKP